MDVEGDVHHGDAARGEVYDSEAGPVEPCRGSEWVVIQLGRYW